MQAATEQDAPRFPVEGLFVDTIGVRPVEHDWSEGYGETWESFEAPDCPECGDYGVWDDELRAWTCPDAECEQHGAEIEDAYGEGPMMNYYYPLPDLNRMGDDPNVAAGAISHLPLCIVSFIEGGYALALTGGGMDLSWEICEAFACLGYLPPLHFCDLPKFAGKRIEGRAAYTVDACKRSAQVARDQAERTLADLERDVPREAV